MQKNQVRATQKYSLLLISQFSNIRGEGKPILTEASMIHN